MPSRRQLKSLLTLCLLCLFSFQALASSGARLCEHSRAGMHEHHHQGMAMHPVPDAKDLLTGCGCGCADRHCASSAAGLGAVNLSAGIVAIGTDTTLSMLTATEASDAHDRDLIRPPSFS
jgi:hypothetical protein